MNEIKLPYVDIDAWDEAWPMLEAAFARDFPEGWPAHEIQKNRDAWNAAITRWIEVDGERVGWVRLERQDDRDWLDLIVVSPDFQRLGIGGNVMQRLLDDARSRGVALWLSVHRDNPARNLYERLGFTTEERDDRRVFYWCE